MNRRGDLEDLEINVKVIVLVSHLSDTVDELTDDSDASVSNTANPPTDAPTRAALDVIVVLIDDVDGRIRKHAQDTEGDARSLVGGAALTQEAGLPRGRRRARRRGTDGRLVVEFQRGGLSGLVTSRDGRLGLGRTRQDQRQTENRCRGAHETSNS